MDTVHNYTLDTKIDDTHLSNRAKKALLDVGVVNISHLMTVKRRYVKHWRNVGKKTQNEIYSLMDEMLFLLPTDKVLSPTEWLADQRIWLDHNGTPRTKVYTLMSDYATYVKNYKPTQ